MPLSSFPTTASQAQLPLSPSLQQLPPLPEPQLPLPQLPPWLIALPVSRFPTWYPSSPTEDETSFAILTSHAVAPPNLGNLPEGATQHEPARPELNHRYIFKYSQIFTNIYRHIKY